LILGCGFNLYPNKNFILTCLILGILSTSNFRHFYQTYFCKKH
jgi:hypothetical protein